MKMNLFCKIILFISFLLIVSSFYVSKFQFNSAYTLKSMDLTNSRFKFRNIALNSVEDLPSADKIGKLTAIIIVDHGSKKPGASESLREICELYKQKFGMTIVEAAHMEISEPSIRTACLRCLDQGATKVICHPYFLGNGKHVQEDIPRLIEEAKSDFPELEIILTKPTGSHENIVNLIHDCIVESL